MTSPTLGRGSSTVFCSFRSACWGVSATSAWLLPESGSNWSAAEMVAVLVSVPGPATVALRVSVGANEVPTVPTDQRPVAGS